MYIARTSPFPGFHIPEQNKERDKALVSALSQSAEKAAIEPRYSCFMTRAFPASIIPLIYTKRDASLSGTEKYILISFITLLLATIVLLWYLFSGRKMSSGVNSEPESPAESPESSEKDMAESPETGRKNFGKESAAGLFLFGDFMLLDDEGNDITKQLSPKLKQFFLMLFIRSCLNGSSGVRTEFLTATLWPELPLAESKNNRNVSVRKIRKILSGIKGAVIEIEKNKILLKLPEDFYCDFVEFRQKTDFVIFESESANEIRALVTRGELFADCDYEWLDDLKQKYREETVKRLLNIINADHISDEKRLALAESILTQDSVSEEGIGVKIRSLSAMGNHASAKSSFEHFKREYHRVYDTEYQKNLTDLLN